MAAMITSQPTLLESLAAWLDSPVAHRRAASWAGDPELGMFPDPASAARAAATDDGIFALLARRHDDPLATTVCLSLLARQLVPIAQRWARSGLHHHELADAEAALVTEALAVIRSDPELGPDRVVQRAWHRVHNQRRTARARATRIVPLSDHVDDPDGAEPPADQLRTALSLISSWIADHTLTVSAAACLWAAICGWSSVQAASVAGCPLEAWRSRHARARRAVRTSLLCERGQ